MVYLQVNQYSTSFQSRGQALNWLEWNGCFPSIIKTSEGKEITIWKKNEKLVNIQIVEYGTNDHMKIEEFLSTL